MNMIAPPPSISIVLPTYNVEKYIDRCLESCIKQTCKNIEIIIVNDCGSDNSLARAQDWAKRDERIKIVLNERNYGTYHARHIGTQNARAPYVIFVDPDDELHLTAAQKITDSVKSSDCDIIFFNHELIPKNRMSLRKTPIPRLSNKKKSLVQNVLSTPNIRFGTPGKAYSRNTLLEAFNFLNIPLNKRFTYAEDALLFFAAIVKSEKILSISEELYKYHQNPGSATNAQGHELLIDNSKQIDYAVSRMNDCCSIDLPDNQKKNARDALNIISSRLTMDKYYMLRHTQDSFGKSLYFDYTLKRILISPRLGDVFRMGVFISSFGKIRI